MAIDTEDDQIRQLLSCCLHDAELESLIYIPRFKIRLQIAKAWSIGSAENILDIGCGQGESCLTLAQQVQSTNVIGIDPSPPSYGTPYNVAESQKYIVDSELGCKIAFIRAEATSFLGLLGQSGNMAVDTAVLCHSLWYFPDRRTIFDVFQALSTAKVQRIFIAEYIYKGSHPAQKPHILASRAQALFHEYGGPLVKKSNELNVRAAPDQATILEAARNAGYQVARDGMLRPGEDMLEGHFSARYTKGENFANRVRSEQLPKEQEDEIFAYAPQIQKAMEELNAQGIEYVRAMDIWWAEFRLEEAIHVERAPSNA